MTTDNTPRNADESYLREQIHSALFADDFPILNDIEKDAVDRVVAIILADRKKHELEARIDENEAWYALGRMVDPREFVAEIGGLELKKQELEQVSPRQHIDRGEGFTHADSNECACFSLDTKEDWL